MEMQQKGLFFVYTQLKHIWNAVYCVGEVMKNSAKIWVSTREWLCLHHNKERIDMLHHAFEIGLLHQA